MVSLKFKSLVSLLFFTGIIIALGCASGGGTAGTGGEESEFSGRVFRTTGEPIGGATISILQSGDSGITDPDGNFLIESAAAGRVQLLVEREDGIRVEVSVDNVPDSGVRVVVEIKIDSSLTSGSITNSEIEDRPHSEDSSGSSSSGGGSDDSLDDGSDDSSGDHSSSSSSGSSSSDSGEDGDHSSSSGEDHSSSSSSDDGDDHNGSSSSSSGDEDEDNSGRH